MLNLITLMALVFMPHSAATHAAQVVPVVTVPAVVAAAPVVASTTVTTLPTAVPGPQPVGPSKTTTVTNCVATAPNGDVTYGGSCPEAAQSAAQNGGTVTQQTFQQTTGDGPSAPSDGSPGLCTVSGDGYDPSQMVCTTAEAVYGGTAGMTITPIPGS